MQDKISRPLTEVELSLVPDPIRATIDLSRIRIVKKPWTFLTPRSVTVARGYNIFWPTAPADALSIESQAHLVHEIVHIWQYNACNVGLYSWRWLDRRYGYDLQPGDDFFRFGLEQQACIIEDRFLVKNGYLPRRARCRQPLAVYDDMERQLCHHQS